MATYFRLFHIIQCNTGGPWVLWARFLCAKLLCWKLQWYWYYSILLTQSCDCVRNKVSTEGWLDLIINYPEFPLCIAPKYMKFHDLKLQLYTLFFHWMVQWNIGDLQVWKIYEIWQTQQKLKNIWKMWKKNHIYQTLYGDKSWKKKRKKRKWETGQLLCLYCTTGSL